MKYPGAKSLFKNNKKNGNIPLANKIPEILKENRVLEPTNR